jgi:hypothetical protein
MVYGEAANRVAASVVLVVNPLKKTCRGGVPDGALPTRSRCGTCGETGNNAGIFQKDIAISSESGASMQYISSDSSGSNNNNQSEQVCCAKTFWEVRWWFTLYDEIC